MVIYTLIAVAIVIGLVTIAYWQHWFFSSNKKLDPKDKAVLVTGCDTGFGLAIAQYLDSLGCQVFAGCLDAHGGGAWKLVKDASDSLTVLQMDVTKDKEVTAALEILEKNLRHPEKGKLLCNVCSPFIFHHQQLCNVNNEYHQPNKKWPISLFTSVWFWFVI